MKHDKERKRSGGGELGIKNRLHYVTPCEWRQVGEVTRWRSNVKVVMRGKDGGGGVETEVQGRTWSRKVALHQ